ncbi:MAG: capsule assembly Wzi family protein [Flavisolibacter sp.]|jgi:hypothetical protein|nr:capsule assembly Wzi family protein [Flavisolibacter sp.]
MKDRSTLSTSVDQIHVVYSFAIKTTVYNIFIFSLLLTGTTARTQSLPVGTPLLEESWRRGQIKGEKDGNISFMLRPLQAQTVMEYDSLYQTEIWSAGKPSNSGLLKIVRLLPLTFKQQYNSHHPYGWNDGSMIPANGYQGSLSFGGYSKLGPLTIQLQPEVVYAQNKGFASLGAKFSDSIWKSYYINVLNLIDRPERFGNRSYAKIFPGQSSVRFSFKKLSLGVSTENLWWGPGIRNALIMSNNAPGFPHITFNTAAPLLSPIGSFEGQLLSGFLKKSGYLSADTGRTVNGEQLFIAKPHGNRYLNGMVITWQPKWTKGLYLGFSRVHYLYQSDVKASFNGYLPVIGHLFKGSSTDADIEDALKRDQLFSLFFRLLLPKEKTELYAEFGRNDHSGDMRDLLLEPEHSRAYVIGFRKLFESTTNTDLELMAEFTNLQRTPTAQLRGSPTWYIHHQVRDGYTNQGQVIGAGIGPGGGSQTIGLNLIKGIQKTGLQLERVTHNNDFYNDAFRPVGDYMRHWVDLSIQLSKNWQHKRFIYDARFSWIKSLNYQWQRGTDLHNLHSSFSASYIF